MDNMIVPVSYAVGTQRASLAIDGLVMARVETKLTNAVAMKRYDGPMRRGDENRFRESARAFVSIWVPQYVISTRRGFTVT